MAEDASQTQESTSSRAPESLPGAAAHWTDSIGHSNVCPNCESEASGSFCPACGQKVLRGRLRLRELIHDGIEKFANVERGLLHTVINMFIRPGQVAKDYVAGKQKRYANPLAYLVLGAAAQLLSLLVTGPFLKEKLERFNGNGTLKQMFGDDPGSRIADVYLLSIQQGYTYAALLFFALPMAFLLSKLHGLADEKFNTGETAVFSMYTVGQMLLVTAVAVPFSLFFIPSISSFIGIALYFVIIIQAHPGFFRPGLVPWIATMMSFGAAMLIFFVSILGIFLATLAIHSYMGWM